MSCKKPGQIALQRLTSPCEYSSLQIQVRGLSSCVSAFPWCSLWKAVKQEEAGQICGNLCSLLSSVSLPCGEQRPQQGLILLSPAPVLLAGGLRVPVGRKEAE